MKEAYTRSDKIFYTVSAVFLVLLLIMVAYPIIFVLSASFSSGAAVSSGKVFLWPVDVSLEGYKAVFRNRDIWRSYGNTIFYVIVGTFINLVMLMTCAYPLSRPNLKGRNIIMFIFTFTMYFSGGLIPSYLLYLKIGILNSRLALLLPGALSVYNMIIVRSFIQSSIPGELYEAASIDGESQAGYFFRILLPLSKPVIAVMALFSMVGHWNQYFNALMFINDRDLYPLQIILREILVLGNIDANMTMDPELQQQLANMADVLKYALIVVSTAPILCVYPFIQKYFVKGVMIGSIKG